MSGQKGYECSSGGLGVKMGDELSISCLPAARRYLGKGGETAREREREREVFAALRSSRPLCRPCWSRQRGREIKGGKERPASGQTVNGQTVPASGHTVNSTAGLSSCRSRYWAAGSFTGSFDPGPSPFFFSGWAERGRGPSYLTTFDFFDHF